MFGRTKLGSIVIVASALVPGASLALADDPWTEANGRNEATRVIDACFANIPDSAPRYERYRCIDKPLDDCMDRHAKNQLTLNECGLFLRQAWEDRLKLQFARARSAGVRIAARLDDTQTRWRAWVYSDCEVLVGKGGSNRNYLWSTCEFRHTAQRATELQDLADDWEGHPPEG